jgi:hypothetical protein
VEPDISILRKSGHFYFALTLNSMRSVHSFKRCLRLTAFALPKAIVFWETGRR